MELELQSVLEAEAWDSSRSSRKLPSGTQVMQLDGRGASAQRRWQQWSLVFQLMQPLIGYQQIQMNVSQENHGLQTAE